MKRILIILFLLPFFSEAQITYFNSAATPADNGTQAGPTVTVTPPLSMVTGDLVLCVVGYKGTGVTMTNSVTGGQTWTAETAAGGATSSLTMRLFWCRYNGTWAANPAFTITTGTLAMSVQMHVFRPTSSSNTWSVSNTIKTLDAAASSSMNFASSSVFQTLAIGDVGFGAVITNDDNTYTNGGNYTTTGTIQYRNLQGNDMAMGGQHRIETISDPNDTPIWSQATLGADTYAGLLIGFHETSSGGGTPKPRRVTIIN